jgi:putative addiction module component (TIGR02574 family)
VAIPLAQQRQISRQFVGRKNKTVVIKLWFLNKVNNHIKKVRLRYGMKTNELFSIVESLPVDIKTKLVEKILNSLYPTQKEIDELWAKEVETRVNEIKTGKVKAIPGDEVFNDIREKFYK